jgi:hypothetical protein
VSLRIGIVVLVGIACAVNRSAESKSISALACPTVRADSTKDSITKVGDSAATRRSRRYPTFLTIIIDGQRAAWNYPTSQMDDYTSPYNPPLRPGELKSMVFVKADVAERLYGSCPGVPVFLIETKSGSWRPVERASSR